MKKYAVYSESFEFDPTKNTDIKSAYFSQNETWPKLIKLCDTLEEALETLSQFSPATRRPSYNLASADIAYINSADYEYDEDYDRWELVDGDSIDCFISEPLEEETEEEL